LLCSLSLTPCDNSRVPRQLGSVRHRVRKDDRAAGNVGRHLCRHVSLVRRDHIGRRLLLGLQLLWTDGRAAGFDVGPGPKKAKVARRPVARGAWRLRARRPFSMITASLSVRFFAEGSRAPPLEAVNAPRAARRIPGEKQC